MGGNNSKTKRFDDSKIASTSDNKKNYDDKAVLAYVAARSGQHIDYIKLLITLSNMPLPILALEYAYLYDIVFYDMVVCPLTKISNFSFFNHAENHHIEYKTTKIIARDHILTAGPLDKLAREVRKYPNILLPQIRITITLSGINYALEGNILQLAIILLDHTIRSEDPNVSMTDKGQAEMLIDLTKELLPDKIHSILEQARLAAPQENKETQRCVLIEQLDILNAAFDAIKKNNPAAAQEIMMNYIKNKKPVIITDNRYFLNLLRLTDRAFNLLLARSQELKDFEYGKQAYQYCIATIGTINKVMPFKLRKILRTELYSLLCKGKNINRNIDVNDAVFLGVSGSKLEVGVTHFYDDFGLSNPRRSLSLTIRAGRFQKLYQQIQECSLNLARTVPLTEKLSDIKHSP